MKMAGPLQVRDFRQGGPHMDRVSHTSGRSLPHRRPALLSLPWLASGVVGTGLALLGAGCAELGPVAEASPPEPTVVRAAPPEAAVLPATKPGPQTPPAVVAPEIVAPKAVPINLDTV